MFLKRWALRMFTFWIVVMPQAFCATVVVNTLADVADGDTTTIAALVAAPGADGHVSLREAMDAAATTPGADRIEFAVSGIISPGSSLPPLTNTGGGTTIDGAGEIRLDGALAPEETHGLVISSAKNEILGLTITRFPGLGIVIDGPDAHNNRVSGCKIGTDGIHRLGNSVGPGIRIANGAAHNFIGGSTTAERNNISANICCGIHIDSGANNNTLFGNYIGLGDDGISALINIGITAPGAVFTSVGVIVLFGASNNMIGGPGFGEGNLISANHVDGVWIASEESTNNTIRGNHFVYDEADNTDYGFDLYPFLGAAIRCSSKSSSSVVGGSQPGEGNVIAGYWETFGILMFHSNDNIVQGNILVDGPAYLLPVNRAGIAADHSTGNLIGGSEPGAGNVIAGRFDSVGIRMHPNNVARGNSVTANDLEAIFLDGDGLAPPTVLGLFPIHGIGPACALVDLYADEEDEARIYLGAVRIDACGRFTSGIDLSEYVGLNLTATVTDESAWMTSELTAPLPIQNGSGEPEEGEASPYDPQCYCVEDMHSADYDEDGRFSLSELLRIIQLFNTPSGFHCDASGEDGFALGGGLRDCPHSLDYQPRDWHISFAELVRGIQFFSVGRYERCDGSEDGYCPVLAEGGG